MSTGPITPSDLVLYRSPKGVVKVGVLVRDETVWLTQKALSELFAVGVPAIAKHLKNIFESGELEEAATVSSLETVRREGSREVRRTVEFYNLDAVIAVGYRVNSYEATQFRIWATGVLRELITKGYVLDKERLEQGPTVFGKDYFDGLLETIREIRASERRFYQKVTDIYATAVDYDPNAPITRDFFASVQNKLHWAITGQTAAERIIGTADADKPHMGLTTWKHAPRGKVMKSDVSIAKNYLNEEELRELEEIVSAYLDLAENRARRGILMKMSDWAAFLNQVLELQEYPILTDKGRVSALEAKLKAEAEYDVFRVRQDREFVSDFDRVVEEAKQLGEGAKPKKLPRKGKKETKS
jgi:hypothetical protein